MALGLCPNCKNGINLPEGYEACICGSCGQQISVSQAAALYAESQGLAGASASSIGEQQPAPASADLPPKPVETGETYDANAIASTNQPSVVPAPAAVPVPSNQDFPQSEEYPYAATAEKNHTLFLVAFVFNLISTICLGWMILPLAWMIPMTVHSYGIYKGKKANSVAFGICTLIFLSVVSGILYLVADKDK